MSPSIPERPTILFTGESVMLGEGLSGRRASRRSVGAMMGMQSANLAVHGFGSDQAYLRLQMELPRFRGRWPWCRCSWRALRPETGTRIGRHLGPGLSWLPAERQGGSHRSLRLLVTYRTDQSGRTRWSQ